MSSTTPPSFALTLDVPNADMVDNELNRAAEAAMEHAKKSRSQGILVTRIGYGKFTLELSGSVPYGIIFERDALARSPIKTNLQPS